MNIRIWDLNVLTKRNVSKTHRNSEKLTETHRNSQKLTETHRNSQKLKETGDTYIEDAGRGYRKVVASPKPVDIHNVESIEKLTETQRTS